MPEYQAIIKRNFKDYPRCASCDFCIDCVCVLTDKRIGEIYFKDSRFTAPAECPMEEVVAPDTGYMSFLLQWLDEDRICDANKAADDEGCNECHGFESGCARALYERENGI